MNKVFLILLILVSLSLAVEGVSPEPRFLEVDISPGEDKITFPSDFEEIFHEPYQEFLRRSSDTPYLSLKLYGSPDTWLRANGRLNKDPYSLSISARRAKINGSTTNFASIAGEAVKYIDRFPIDGFVELAYAERAFLDLKPRHVHGRGRLRFTVPLEQDVIALIIDGYGSQWEHLAHYRQVGIDARLAHQHHFGTYFGEEIILHAGYQMSQITSLPSLSHRLLQVRAGLFYKRGVFLGRVGLTSADSYGQSITAPFLEMWIDHHSLRTSITYSESIVFPRWGELSRHSLAEGEIFGYLDPMFEPDPTLPEEKHRTIHVYGSLEPFQKSKLSFSGKYTVADDHVYPIMEDGEKRFASNNANFINFGAGFSTDFESFTNGLFVEVNYERLPDEGRFLPFVPRWSLIDSVKYTHNEKLGLFLTAGLAEGIRHDLYYPEADGEDVEGMKLVTAGLNYHIKDFIVSIHAENLAGEIYDRYGYKYPPQIFFGLGYKKK